MSERRLAGRDEPIIDPDLKIIDAHHHLFDRPAVRYLLADYLEDADLGHNIVASVYCEAGAFLRNDGPEPLRPIGEIEFANGAAAVAASGHYGTRKIAAGIIGHADLRLGDGIENLLDRAMAAAPDRFRGIRQITLDPPTDAPFRIMGYRPPAGVLQSPGFLTGLRAIARRGLSFDAAVYHMQLPDLAKVASACPDATIILNHLGMPLLMELDPQAKREAIEAWRRDLSELAQRPNVFCKIGGLGLATWDFGFDGANSPAGSAQLAEVWKPFIETAITAFGVDRCMMESNYPPDGRSAGFVPLWNALKLAVAGFSQDERGHLFHDNAARIYRLVL